MGEPCHMRQRLFSSGENSMRQPLLALVSALGVVSGLQQAVAADLEWEVDNPFRFYKVGSSFALHEKAFAAVRGNAESLIPADIVWRTERRLNDPDCRDKTTPATCGATAGRGYEPSRLGWRPRPSRPCATTAS